MRLGQLAIFLAVLLLTVTVFSTQFQRPGPIGVNPETGAAYYLNCTLPEAPSSMPVIRAYPTAMTEAESKQMGIKLHIGSNAALDGGSSLYYYGGSPDDKCTINDPATVTWMGDNLRDKVCTLIPFKGYTLVHRTTTIGGSGSSSLEGSWISYWNVHYDGYIGDYPIFETKLVFGLRDGEVVDLVLSLPSVEEVDGSVAVVSPRAALGRFVESYRDTIYPRLTAAYVNRVTLGYLYDARDMIDPYNYYPEVVYRFDCTGVLFAGRTRHFWAYVSAENGA